MKYKCNNTLVSKFLGIANHSIGRKSLKNHIPQTRQNTKMSAAPSAAALSGGLASAEFLKKTMTKNDGYTVGEWFFS